MATYSDGTPIPQVTVQADWENLTTGAWCYNNNDPANGAIYGKLYNWYAVAGIHDTDPNTPNKKLAPTGYHIPSEAEWSTLTTYLVGQTVAGGKMKSTGTTLWNSPNQDATNSSGFTGLPGGFRYSDGTFYNIGLNGSWWSSSEGGTLGDTGYPRYLFLRDDDGSAYNMGTSKEDGFSVRCVRD